jgi:aminopeptidase N
MRRIAVVLGVLAACGGSDENLPKGPIAAQVTHYDLTLDLDSRAATATVTATVMTGGDCLTLPFRGQDLTSAKLDGTDATTTVDAATITACGRGWKAGDTVTLETAHTIALATLSASQVGYSTTTDKDHNSYDYLLSWVNECDRFAPCDNRPDQFATYTFDVTHAAGTTVRCPGTVTDVSATETTCDFEYEGGPTYSTFGVIASSAWTQTDLGTWAGVHVTLYDRASTGVAAAIDPAYHTGFLTWMESQLGPFPYGSELRVLTAPTYWDGFEHPGNIVLSDGLAGEKGAYLHPVEHVLDHEMTHMWAGNQTTLAGTYDFAWKESMAEYLPFVYETMADPAAATATRNYWKNASAQARYFPVPDDKPMLFDYYGDAYGPGPMVLFRQLEALTSRDQVLAAIKSVLGHPHALSIDDLVAALSTSTGLDLTAYSAAWIHGTGRPVWPQVMTTFTPGTGTSTLTVHQVTAQNRTCKFHVGLEGANAGEEQLVEVDTYRNGVDQTISVPTPAFTVSSVSLDPLAECLVYGAGFTAAPRIEPWVTH